MVPEPVGNSTLNSAPVVVMELLQGLDEQVVHREPDRTAPVRVAAKKAGRRLARLIVNAMFNALHGQLVGVVAMELGESANAIMETEILFRPSMNRRMLRSWS